MVFLDDKLWKRWVLQVGVKHSKGTCWAFCSISCNWVTLYFSITEWTNLKVGNLDSYYFGSYFFPYCCAVGGAVFSMSSIWMIVEYFVVVKYLLSLNVRTVTSLIEYVLFSTSVKLNTLLFDQQLLHLLCVVFCLLLWEWTVVLQTIL